MEVLIGTLDGTLGMDLIGVGELTMRHIMVIMDIMAITITTMVTIMDIIIMRITVADEETTIMKELEIRTLHDVQLPRDLIAKIHREFGRIIREFGIQEQELFLQVPIM